MIDDFTLAQCRKDREVLQLKIKTNDEVPHPANRRAEISPLN